MKNFTFIYFAFFFLSVNAQNVSLNYYSTGAGKNITLAYSKEIKTMEFGIGLGCNINSIKQPDDQSNIYYKRLFATKPLHFLNFNLYYNQYVFNKLGQFKPFLFYDLQMKYSTTRSSMYSPYSIDTMNNFSDVVDPYLYRRYIEYFGPFLWVENTIGIGLKIMINQHFFITQKFGFGIHFIIGDEIDLSKFKTEYEFHDFFSFSIGYKF
ncbi:MAG: hypothetical protein H6Q25_701 [Bacteroidetes bacterium]|nr:hypothetical protein [Bacteroidota bacterium]